VSENWYSIGKRYTFSAAHQLGYQQWSVEENESAFGKCARLHGHNYGLIVEVSGEINPETGMVLNYYDLDDVVNSYIINKYDHRFLNDIKPFSDPGLLTTAENLVTVIRQELRDLLHPHQLSMVEVNEGAKSFARWIK